MKYFDLYASYPDYTIAAAWDSQSKEADKTASLADTLTQCEGELYPRFAACYAELRALPRAARRALQRRLARSDELAAILPEYLQQGGRRLQHRMAWSLAGAALLLALSQGVATAATITVTTNNPNIAADGQCSLIEAIVNANNDAATHADCPPGNGADTIVLPANANLTLSAIDNNALGPTGLPLITSRITIEGNGATIARQGNAPAFRLMAVINPGNLTLQRVTLSGGSSSGVGGGVLNGGFSSGVGGGVLHPGGTLTIRNSIISGNTANSLGGGIYDYSGTLTVENSTISHNTADAGGGVFNSYGTVMIKNSTISSNAAIGGGGVYNAPGSFGLGGGSLTITNSTISGNTATNNGGGISAYSLTINNSTISGNIAINSGGGVDNSLSCFYCGYGVLTLNNSLIAGNQAAVGPEIASPTTVPLNTVTANNFNLFGANGNAGVSGFTPGPTDIVPGVSLAQILGPLKNNGGPTQTHALLAGSPAVDAGDPVGCRDNLGSLLTTDQRGFVRTVDGNSDGTVRCDIGAVEFGAVEFGAGSGTLVDFDGDSKSDIGIYRNGAWFIRRSTDSGMTVVGWGGAAGDILVPADYDGDGKTDVAIYRSGAWFIVNSTGGTQVLGWGGAVQDIPVQADYDGDGKADVAVYRDGAWFIRRSTDSCMTVVGWGGAVGDEPVPADYDGDGKTDVAVYRDGVWFIRRSTDSGMTVVGWGGAVGDEPVPADYDGDGKTDVAIYRSGAWFIVNSTGGTRVLGWGGAIQDIPVPADYDGDGKTDVAVYRDGAWFIRRSTDSGMTVIGWGGAPGDIPLN